MNFRFHIPIRMEFHTLKKCSMDLNATFKHKGYCCLLEFEGKEPTEFTFDDKTTIFAK